MFGLRRICAVLCLLGVSRAQEVRVPQKVAAGTEASISTAGSGKATFYLFGPGVSHKNEVNLGEDIHLQSDDLRIAGEYFVVLCSGDCQSNSFFVTAAKASSLTFLVHPSRVPVAQSDAVSGVAIPFDKFRNLVLAEESVNFALSTGKASVMERSVPTKDGIAWFRTASGKTAGAVQVEASLHDIATRRAVQQVASDPCNLRITGQRNSTGILVQTEPVHDCAGNPVPDGTIVTFTATAGNDKSTVDAPIKQDIARAQIAASGPVTISAASGVVMGNELHMGAGR
jgi:hypothetical protein